MAQKEMIPYSAPSLARVVAAATLTEARTLRQEQAGLAEAALDEALRKELPGPGIRLAQVPRRVIAVEMALTLV
jgi:hypothetical protein